MFDPLSNFKLNKILSAVNALPTTLASSFTEVKNAISGVQNTANTINKTTNSISGTVGTINTNVNTLVAGRVVKSVQRGTYNAPFAQHPPYSISISSVNTAKSLVFIEYAGGSYGNASIYAVLNTTSITLNGNFEAGTVVAWQVVEYY